MSSLNSIVILPFCKFHVEVAPDVEGTDEHQKSSNRDCRLFACGMWRPG
jgi:hypothetical protein